MTPLMLETDRRTERTNGMNFYSRVINPSVVKERLYCSLLRNCVPCDVQARPSWFSLMYLSMNVYNESCGSTKKKYKDNIEKRSRI